MRIRDKIVTAACRTENGIEWTSFKIKPDEQECIQQDSRVFPGEGQAAEIEAGLPADAHDYLQGDLTVALRTVELLMRTMEFPTSDPAEIAEMVGFQIDKISPFPSDQLAVSHEILTQNNETSLVLMVAARREGIDAIGDAFKKSDVRIHSIDVRVLGWLRLLSDKDQLTTDGCQIYLICDSIEQALVVVQNGNPIAFRTLHAELDDLRVLEELTYEIGYTLTMLDAEHDLPAPSSIQFWSWNSVPAPLRAKLQEKTGLKTELNDLNSLAPLSEGIIRRALHTHSKIELIPMEWVQFEERRKLRKKFTLASGVVISIWLAVLLVFFIIFKTREINLNKVQARADAKAPAAQEALENRKKLGALKVYAKRSDSSLECLREITQSLPAGDIEFVSYNYKKGKGVTLRGTAESDNLVYDYFEKLTALKLFDRLKDQSVNTKTTKGQRRAVFSVSLELPAEEES